MSATNKYRVLVYVDGFNLYFGMHAKATAVHLSGEANPRPSRRNRMSSRQLADYPDLFTIAEYAEICRRGRRQSYEDVRLGRVPSIRLGGTIRIPRMALEQMLAGAGTVTRRSQTE